MLGAGSDVLADLVELTFDLMSADAVVGLGSVSQQVLW